MFDRPKLYGAKPCQELPRIDKSVCRIPYPSAEKTYNFPPTVIFANNLPQKVCKSEMQQIATKKT